MSSTIDTAPAAPTWRDRVIRFAEAATTPLLPADYLDLFTPLRSGADLRGKVVAIEPETRDSVTITIRPGRDWQGHRPGQYIRIGVDVNGVRQWRAYSLTSRTDRTDGCITITTKAIPDGKVSNHLVRQARVGQIIQLDQAAGEFVLPDPAPAKTLFVTAGSGVTPVMGMLRNGVPGDVTVLHCAPSAADSIFREELQAMADAGRIRLVARYDDTHGILDTSDLPDLVPDLAERTTYACGPVGLLEALEKQWADLGVPDQLHTERFRPVVVSAGEGGTVTFARGGAVVEADGTTPILDAAEEAGVLMPSGCRMGICFGCVLPMREGAVRDLRNGELTIATPGDGVVIQTCISAAAGACTLEH